MGFFSKKDKPQKAESNGKTVRVLAVCGSGTVSSTMIATKMEDRFQELGYSFEAVEVNPGGIGPALMSGHYDFIAYTSPIEEDVGLPAINAVGFMTGFAEEEFMEQALQILKTLGK